MAKQILHLIILFVFLGLANGQLRAQCNPDPLCSDIGGEPGQICPDTIPQGVIGEPYETVVTILPPYAFVIFPVVEIQIDTILNLPPGIEYELSSKIMYPDNLYCAILYGTPLSAGTWPLKISVTAILEWNNSQFSQTVVDSTSVVFTVNLSADIQDFLPGEDFEVLHSSPNPFLEKTKIGYLTDVPVEAELKVYNLLGQVIYTEKLNGNSGKQYFQFSGEELRSGTYIYSISANNRVHTGRFMKISK